MAHDRRRSTRVTAGWQGRYTLDDHPDEHYRCTIVDVSLGGAGLVLFGPAPLDNAGMHVELNAPIPQFRARLRCMGPATTSGVQVGVEWQELTREHIMLLNAVLKQTFLTAS
jgi:hypothetical protein